jgi:hypothetical protein
MLWLYVCCGWGNQPSIPIGWFPLLPLISANNWKQTRKIMEGRSRRPIDLAPNITHRLNDCAPKRSVRLTKLVMCLTKSFPWPTKFILYLCDYLFIFATHKYKYPCSVNLHGLSVYIFCYMWEAFSKFLNTSFCIGITTGSGHPKRTTIRLCPRANCKLTKLDTFCVRNGASIGDGLTLLMWA